MGEGAAPERIAPPLLAQPPTLPTSVPPARETMIPDHVVTPEWTRPAQFRMAIAPIHALLVLGAALVVGTLWYGYSGHGERPTPLTQGVGARAPREGPSPASAPVTPDTGASALAGAVPDATKFEGAYRAGKSMEGALAIGVSYKGFEGLLQAFANELVTTKDRVTAPFEQTLFERYTEVLTTYQDSAVLWKEQDDQALKYGWANAPERNPERLIVVEGDVIRIVQRYGLPTRRGPDATVIPSTSIQFLWTKAATQLAAASAAASIR